MIARVAAARALLRATGSSGVEHVVAALGAVVLAALLAVAALVLVLGACFSALATLLGAPGPRAPVGPSANLGEIPPAIMALLPGAAATCPGLPWPVLAAIARVESDFTPTAVGPVIPRFAGTADERALGLMQFLPSTYRGYAARVDGLTGKHLGAQGIWDAESALAAAALYLCDNGAPGDLRRALFAYNNADWYVDEVLDVARRYGYLAPGQAPPGGGSAVVAVASRFLDWPYVWGGASPADGGFDCSGLVQYAFAQVGVRLPRTAAEQFDAVTPVTDLADLEPGDLLFFADTYQPGISHVGIYLGGGQMINAPAEGQPIGIMAAFTGYWGAHFAGAGWVAVSVPPRDASGLQRVGDGRSPAMGRRRAPEQPGLSLDQRGPDDGSPSSYEWWPGNGR